MQKPIKRSSIWGWSGLVIGLAIGTAGVARAKFQCPSDTNVGRTHAATLLSASVDGQPIVIPSSADVPELGMLVFKTEFDALPDAVHVEVFDPSASPPVRKMHLRREQ